MATAPLALPALSAMSPAVSEWVASVRQLTQPERVHWCEGSDDECRGLIAELEASGELQKLNEAHYPNCFLARSHPSDVARVEHLTFVCTTDREDAGPNNHWMAPADAKAKMLGLFEGCMKGRTLYVVPYCMGPIDSPYSRCGVEITDSGYVAVSMGIMHFPEELSIMSFGSGYGGNALLGKKCHALRIASYQARNEGWLAEHMLIVGLTSPQGETHYVAAAFPSACGKTNLAMLIPPETMPGWKVTTVGDDIAWLHPGPDGRLYAINPEAGYFGVVPGTNRKTNRNAFEMIQRDTLFTNVGLTADHQPWWEGLDTGTPVIDWQGRPYDPANGPAAQPNSRFTVSAKRNPSYAPEADSPRGVPISAIIFGGRRRGVAPLVYEARDWSHGVLVGASVASETTAAAIGQAGVLRRDPMAMKPFAGYNYGDYWAHWLAVGAQLKHPPKIYHVNWFRRDADGKFLWPGFGDNLRVLEWIIDRCSGKAGAQETAIGNLPREEDLNLAGLDLAPGVLAQLLSVQAEEWRTEAADIEQYLDEYGTRTPAALRAQAQALRARLG